jgi:predicted ATPase
MARAIDPSFQPGPAVGELCARLDNFHSRSSFAAAQTARLTPEQILTRLSQRLDLLTGGRDADARQQTLRATIEWSHELLADPSVSCSRSSVSSRRLTLEAAEEIATQVPTSQS